MTRNSPESELTRSIENSCDQSVNKVLNSPGRHGDTDDFRKFIRKTGIPENIYIDIPEGSKASNQSHDDRDNWARWEDLCRNRAIMPAGDLAFIDIDDMLEVPDWVLDLPETLTVQSPHGGYHLYYLIDGEISNRKPDWGEIRVDDWYVMAPGSTIDHDEFCDDCGFSGEGRYEVFNAHEIAIISTDQLPDSQANETAQNSQEHDGNIDLSWDHVDFHVKSRLRKAKNAKNGERFTALWEGRYRDAGFGTDRSKAEASLVCRLAFWMEGDGAVVRGLMNHACNEHPTTQWGEARKWLERPDYRSHVMKGAFETVDEYYDSGESHRGPRPEVSTITMDGVLTALLDLGIARTTELVEHDAVDRGPDAVRRALKQYVDNDAIEWVRDGRQTYYYVFKSMIPKEKRDELGINPDTPGGP